MPSEWITPCGIPYRWYEDGRFEVEGAGFPDYALTSSQAGVIKRVWERWGQTCVKAAGMNGCPVSWPIGIICIESGGDPTAHSSVAFGLMQFIPSTAAMYGHDVDFYMQNPDQMIYDGLDLLVRKKKSSAGILGNVKGYNGGSPCVGQRKSTDMTPGVLNMYGEGNYVEKFVRHCNTFVALGLAGTSGGTLDPDSASVEPNPLIAMGLLLTGMFGTYWAVQQLRIFEWVESRMR